MVAFECVLAQKMPKALSPGPFLRSDSSDIVQNALYLRDEGEVTFPVQQGYAPFGVPVRHVKGEACVSVSILESED